MITLNSTLEDIMKLDFASREMLLEILQHRQIEAWREEVAKEARRDLKEYRAGKFKPLTAEEAIAELNKL